MNKIVLFIMLLLLPTLAQAQDAVSALDNSGLVIINEELRQSSSGIRNLKGQIADLLPIDLSLYGSSVTNQLTIQGGGTGALTAQGAIDNITIPTSGTSGQVWTTNGTNGGWQDVGGTFVYSSGATVLADASGAVSNSTTTYTKVKEIVLSGGSGTLYFSYDMCVDSTSSSSTAKGKIYRNGVAVGSENSSSDTCYTYGTYTDTVSGWSDGDLIQLYIKEGGSYTARAKNFKVMANILAINLN